MPRVLYLAAHLLDRQLLDRDGVRCGKVDDVELVPDPATGQLHVEALCCGPGALLTRTGHSRLGGWLRRVQGLLDGDRETGVIPLGQVVEIGDHVQLRVEAATLATHGGERWVRDHVIGPIPGSGRRVGR